MRRGLALAATAAAALGLLAIAWIDPERSRWLPVCLLHAATGLFCAGCGATRALHALLSGNLTGALAFNPLLILSLPVLLPALFVEARRVATGEERRGPLVPAWAGFAVLVVLVVYGVLRNVPGFELLGPPR